MLLISRLAIHSTNSCIIQKFSHQNKKLQTSQNTWRKEIFESLWRKKLLKITIRTPPAFSFFTYFLLWPWKIPMWVGVFYCCHSCWFLLLYCHVFLPVVYFHVYLIVIHDMINAAIFLYMIDAVGMGCDVSKWLDACDITIELIKFAFSITMSWMGGSLYQQQSWVGGELLIMLADAMVMAALIDRAWCTVVY